MFLLLYFYLFNVSRTEQRDYISENRNIFDLFWLLTEQCAKKNVHSVAFNLEGTCRPNTFRVNERRNWGTLRVEWAANVGKLSYVGKVHGAPQELRWNAANRIVELFIISSLAYWSAAPYCSTAAWTIARSPFISLLAYWSAVPLCLTAAWTIRRSPFISSGASLNAFSPVRIADIVRSFSSLAPSKAPSSTPIVTSTIFRIQRNRGHKQLAVPLHLRIFCQFLSLPTTMYMKCDE